MIKLLKDGLLAAFLGLLCFSNGDGAQAKVEELSDQERGIVVLLNLEWSELHKAIEHLVNLRESLAVQMVGVERRILEEHELDPQRWQINWDSGRFEPKMGVK